MVVSLSVTAKPCLRSDNKAKEATRFSCMPIYLEYYFWLVFISVSMFVLERFFPRNSKQEIVRSDLVQDLFWLIFNAQCWILARIFHTRVDFQEK